MSTAIRTIIIVAVAVLTFSGCIMNRTMHPVTWSEVKQEIGSYICVVTDTTDLGDVYIDLELGTYGKCGNNEAQEQLTRAVEDAMKRAHPLLIGLQPEDVGFTFDSDTPLSQRDADLREVCLSSERFLRPIVNRLDQALERNRLICQDCPAFEPRPVRTVSWGVFKHYLTAYAWSTEYVPPNEDEQSASDTRYVLYICIGINGVGQIEDPDPFLSSTAYTIAINSEKFLDLAFSHFRDILKSEAIEALSENSTRLQYLRDQLKFRLIQDEKLKKIACQYLDRYFSDLRLQLDCCPETRE